MSAAIQDLIARLNEGATFEGLLRSFLSQPEQELLKRCAAVRKFDELIVDKVFRRGLSGATKDEVPFENLTRQSLAEPVVGLPGFYQLRESARNEYFEAWHKSDESISPELRALSQELVLYYEGLGRGWELDVLYQLIVSNSDRAQSEFNRLYDEADSGFDLGRCQDLLKILEARHTILSHSLLRHFQERTYYLKARGLWSREYYQTAYYYKIDELDDKFQIFLADRSKWILELHAPGGLGKTMFLRWLIARRCVPQPLRIPCARIDFDFIDPVTATQMPSILLMEIAQQLNEQIPGNLFADALSDLKEFRPILARSDSSMQDNSQLRAAAKRRAGLRDIPDRFVDALASVKTRVIVIFDTLEEVILYSDGADMMALLGQMKKLQESYPKLCLILSGRYDLGQKLDGFTSEYDKQFQILEVKRFEDVDARKYLTEKRGITRLLDPVIRRAQGNPFQLSLYADILRSNPRLTTREIEAFPSGLLYLIKRILSRIPDRRVRWLLRYGVVPRKLRLSFVEEVMAPYLPHAMAGESPFDDPSKDLEVAFASENPFQKTLRSPKSRIHVVELWQKLTQYASTNSWVSPDKEDDTLSFHPEVLNPMRRLLRKQTIFRKLHRAAIRYYEKKAKILPNNAGHWLPEAVYHKFQLDGMKAGAYWRKQLANPLIARNPESVQALSREVVNLAAQSDDDQQPGQLKDALVDKALRCEAYFEIARANVEIARANQVAPQDVLWQEAGKDYRIAVEMQKELKRTVIPRARMSYVQAAILINQKDLTTAHAVLSSALKLKAKSDDKIRLEIEFADSLSHQGKPREAARHYRGALKLAPAAKLKSSQVIEIRKRLAGHHEHLGEADKAIQEYKVALALAGRSRNFMATLELSRHLAEVYLVTGQLEKATALAAVPPETPATKMSAEETAKYGFERLLRLHLKGRIEREELRPLVALSTWTGMLTSQDSISDGANVPGWKYLSACTHEQIGLVSAELMEISKALDELEQARSLFKESDDDEGANRCLLHMIHIQLRYARNIKAARLLLDQVDFLSSKTLTPAATRQELLRIAVFDQLDRPLTAQRRWRRLASGSKAQKWPTVDRASIALAGMMHRARAGSPISLRESVATLRQLHPPSQRVMLLDEMRWCPTSTRASGKLSTAFSKLLPTPDFKTHAGALSALKMADALRVVGRKRSPRSLLLGAQESFTKTDDLFGILEVYRAWDRLGWTNQNVAELSSPILRFLEDHSNYWQLCLVVRLEHARRLLRLNEPDLAQQMLDDAEKLFVDRPVGAYWMAVFNELSGRLLIQRHWSTHKRDSQLEDSQREVLKQALVLLVRAKSAYNVAENRLALKRLDRYANTEKKRLDAVLLGRPPGTKIRKKKARPAARAQKLPASTDSQPAEEFAQSLLSSRGYFARIHRVGSKKLTIQGNFANRPAPSKRVVVKPTKGLAYILSAPTDEMVSRSFVKLFSQEWLSVSHDMFSMFMTDDVIRKSVFRGKANAPLNVGLDIGDMLLAGVPWEFALLGPFQETDLFSLSIDHFYRTCPDSSALSWAIRFLQTALQKIYPQMKKVDGFYGPETVRTVQEFQRQNDLQATGVADHTTLKALRAAVVEAKSEKQVLIVQPSSERQIASARGHAGSGGVSLPSTYSRLGFKVEVLEYPTMPAFAKSLLEGKPQTIHLCPLMKRSPTIGIQLDFGTSFQFSLSSIGKVLDDFSYANKFRPFVILDVPRPPVFSEAVTQLMLRNGFASELFRMGGASAILATGLAEQFDQQHSLTRNLISSLADGLSFGNIVNRIREMSHEYLSGLTRKELAKPEALNAIMGPSGTALFTQDPRIWLL